MTSGSHQMSRVSVLQIAEAAGSHPCREEVLRGLPDISNGMFVAQFNGLWIQQIQIYSNHGFLVPKGTGGKDVYICGSHSTQALMSGNGRRAST